MTIVYLSMMGFLRVSYTETHKQPPDCSAAPQFTTSLLCPHEEREKMNTHACIVFALSFLLAVTTSFKLNRLFMSRARLTLLEAEQLGRVTMYKKQGCPHCVKAMDTLVSKYGLDVTEVDIEGEKQEDILLQMRQFSGGRNTVPQIFFNEEHIGGNDDVQALDSEGQLEEKAEKVKSTPAMMQDGWFHPWY